MSEARPQRRGTVDGMRPLAGALDEVLAALAPPDASGADPATAATVGGVFARWADAVGPHVAAHARPVRLTGSRLVVEVDEPGWATQLRYLEAELVERLARAAGPGVQSIELRVRRR
jgi:predicted nucleic acid-binding Zn ribbon protein